MSGLGFSIGNIVLLGVADMAVATNPRLGG